MLAPNTGAAYNSTMRVISLKTLREFWHRYLDAEEPLRVWYQYAAHADWQTPGDIKQLFSTASFVANDRVVFNIRETNIV